MAVYGLIVFALPLLAAAEAEKVNPIQKVVQLMGELEGKIIAEGDAEEKAFKEFFEWCDDAARNAQFEVKTASALKAKLEATIAKAESDGTAATEAIEAQSASIATDEADLKAATAIRAKELAVFQTSEKELSDAVDALERAIGILSRNQKGSALVQTPADSASLELLLKTVSTLIDAASFSDPTKETLAALMQNNQASDDDDAELGAPAPDAYKSHSSSITDVLSDMKEKAEAQLAEARKTETNSQHNFDMMKQGLTDEIAAATHELNEAKANKADAAGTKAISEGDLGVVSKDLAVSKAGLDMTAADCMQHAQDHDVSKQGRAAELKAIGAAKKMIQESTSGAEKQQYFFLQIGSGSGSHLRSASDLRNFEVVNAVKRLAAVHHSIELSQLASRIAATLHYSGATGDDPFAKVKGLIDEMIARLMQEAADEAGHKAYCDEEMAKTNQKKDELNTDIDKLSSKIDQAGARSAQLKELVGTLQKELADLADSQAEMDKIREDEKAIFTTAKAELEEGITGIQGALKILRDMYGESEALLQDNTKFDAFMQQPGPPSTHEKQAGAGGSIISFLEVIESDFSQNLAQIETEETSASTEYEKQTQENKVTRATKEQDVKYNTKEYEGLDKEITELTGDRDGAQTELDAVMEYDAKIKDQCIAKPEPYEERKKRREAEIAGLKEALEILEGQAAFLQRRSGLRGVSTHRKL